MKKSEIRQVIREVLREEMDPREVNVFGYQTKHFDVCPGAQGLYKKIAKEFDGDKDLAIRSAKLHDALFAMEKNAIEMGGNELDVQSAQIIADQIMEMAKMMGLEKEHDYVQNHVNIIRDSINKKN